MKTETVNKKIERHIQRLTDFSLLFVDFNFFKQTYRRFNVGFFTYDENKNPNIIINNT